MEEKYLFSDEKQQPGKLYHRNDIDEKLKKKHYEASE